MPVCSACGNNQLKTEHKFCPNCGVKNQPEDMPSCCGKTLDSSCKFCPECGKNVSKRLEELYYCQAVDGEGNICNTLFAAGQKWCGECGKPRQTKAATDVPIKKSRVEERQERGGIKYKYKFINLC